MTGYKGWICKYIESLIWQVTEAVHEWNLFATKTCGKIVALKEAEKDKEDRLRHLNND